MDLPYTLSIATSGAHVPIAGNGNIGGACYAGNGQALYGVYDTDGFKVYRTRVTYTDLYTQDSSVDYLSTILTTDVKSGSASPSMSLQRIDGQVYAVLSGWLSSGTAGTWIYRDATGTGAGPWALLGTVQTASGMTGNNKFGMTPFASEILISGGLWCINAPVFAPFNGTDLSAQGGVYTSPDGGATWTNRLTVGWYNQGIYGYGWSRNFGEWAGAWYVGGNGNVAAGQHFKSTDLTTWTSIGDLGTGNGFGYTFPVSDPANIYRWAPATSDYTSARVLQAASAPPENSPAWVTVADTSALSFYPTSSSESFPLLCQIGPDAGLTIIATNYGRVVGIARRAAGQPPCRRYPREDGLASSSAPRHYPPARSQQGGYRKIGYY